MGYLLVTSRCAACPQIICFHPDFVPSIRVNGEKEALCASCFDKWNEIHRVSKGLEPIKIHPEAYNPKSEDA
jgi:hypothetical protein